MSDLNNIKVTLGQEDELVALYEQVDDDLSTKISSGDEVTAKSAPIYVTISRGIGYVYAGVFNIIKDALFYPRLKTKSGAVLRTKSGSTIITTRNV